MDKKGFTLNGMQDELGKLMDMTAEGLKGFQKGAIGEVPKTPRERSNMFNRMMAMKPSDRVSQLKDALTLSGHTGPQDGCEMCNFVAEQVDKRK